MEKLLNDLIVNNKKWTSTGKVASYIPELSKKSGDKLGIYIKTLEGHEYFAGDYKEEFTIQSISKVISLMLALSDKGYDYVFSKVGTDPTTSAFNSITNLETDDIKKPLNPMINAGAIAVVSFIDEESSDEKFKRILRFTKKITNNNNITLNNDVYACEKSTGNRNRSLAYFMKSLNIIEGDVEEVLDVYFKQCSINVTCQDIGNIGAVLANNGVLPWNNEEILTKDMARVIKSLMVTCGMYGGSGNFAVNIGLPAKSGVGGGIMAISPGKMGIGVYGPSLDEKGNSIAGISLLKELSNTLDLSIF